MYCRFRLKYLETDPDTLLIKSNMAGVLYCQGKYEQSMKLNEDVLNIRTEVLGNRHPDVVATKSNMAGVLKRQECATSHKEDGNYHFQKKDYETAIKAYTEGLKQKHEDSILTAVLYTNRAAAHFHLGNNRSALNDAIWALKSKPDHMKAIVRAAICCFDLEKYDECISWCERGLKVNNKEQKLLELKKKSSHQKQVKLIPAFCYDVPTQEDIDKSPALQAFPALKYEEENHRECATSHKEDGNYHFQKKDYKTAIKAYTEGLKQKHEDSMLTAVLYANRAAANFHLGNNRSALNDAIWALKSKPDHMKAIVRAAICCFELENYGECISWCERGLKVNNEEPKLLELKKKSSDQEKQEERDRRKHEMKEIKDLTAQKELIDAITNRNIVLEKTSSELDELQKLLMNNNSPHAGKIYLDDNKVLHWPVYLLYPEFNQSDLLEDFSEDQRFEDQLSVVFDVAPDWDVEKCYIMQHIQIYFEDRSRSLLVHVSSHVTLKKVLTDRRYIVRGCCPAFVILSTKTNFYQQTIEKQQVEEF